MKKFICIDDEDDRNLIYRSQFPRYIFQLTDNPEVGRPVKLYDLTYYVREIEDLNNFGEAPESYLKELVRWYYHEGHTDEYITLEEIGALRKEPKESDLELKKVFELLNGSFVAADCFARDRTWFYQRLNGNTINGKPAEFNQEQKTKLADYLRLKAQLLIETADLLAQ
ncbi:DUF5053 domain-containing protein [Dyadobacter frigoris]|uniref:DUF5053 domain-containing protein n=1 Tax=Dyadobacter frigoris TaxID=2576211 RepID=A0A4U6CXS3_9BACT|nr:DUF5053 domain-containing protein [Dyadobacter frigoris]TKT89512.1 DUF5053 domain-containing protein [Dyadobacter frigoris]